MPSQVAAPIPITPRRDNLRLATPLNVEISSQQFFASLNATLSSKGSQSSIPVYTVREHDYSVPDPPPPSPVSFRTEHWQSSSRR